MAAQKKNNVKTVCSDDLPVVKRQSSPTAFDPDYTYVAENLKKIGILAVCFIAILVILSFIL